MTSDDDVWMGLSLDEVTTVWRRRFAALGLADLEIDALLAAPQNAAEVTDRWLKRSQATPGAALPFQVQVVDEIESFQTWALASNISKLNGRSTK